MCTFSEDRDPIDVSARTTEQWLDSCIKAARGIPSATNGNPKASADECVECGELIPSERQIAVPGCQLCVECASVMEMRR